jgi:hypothetical protein
MLGQRGNHDVDKSGAVFARHVLLESRLQKKGKIASRNDCSRTQWDPVPGSFGNCQNFGDGQKYLDEARTAEVTFLHFMSCRHRRKCKNKKLWQHGGAFNVPEYPYGGPRYGFREFQIPSICPILTFTPLCQPLRVQKIIIQPVNVSFRDRPSIRSFPPLDPSPRASAHLPQHSYQPQLHLPRWPCLPHLWISGLMSPSRALILQLFS